MHIVLYFHGVCNTAFEHASTDIDLSPFVHIVLDHEKHFFAVCEETASVVQWFTLRLYLKIAPYELERISVDYRFNREGLQQMLSAWLKTGAAC